MALAVGITLQSNNGPADAAKQKKILVFAKTNGYHHESIAEGIAAIQKLGLQNKFAVDSTTDSLKIADANRSLWSICPFYAHWYFVFCENGECWVLSCDAWIILILSVEKTKEKEKPGHKTFYIH